MVTIITCIDDSVISQWDPTLIFCRGKRWEIVGKGGKKWRKGGKNKNEKLWELVGNGVKWLERVGINEKSLKE